MTAAFDNFMKQYVMTGTEKADGYSQNAFTGLDEHEKLQVFELLTAEIPFSVEWLFFLDAKKALPVARKKEAELRGNGYTPVYKIQEELLDYTQDIMYQTHMIEDYMGYAESVKPLVIDAIGRTPVNKKKIEFLKKVILTEINADAVARAARKLLGTLEVPRENKLEEELFQRTIAELRSKNTQVKLVALDKIKACEDAIFAKLNILQGLKKMMASASNPGLASFYEFFKTYGMPRLSGLNESHFIGLNESEKEEAWNFLVGGASEYLSYERISGLYILDEKKSIELFKKRIELPIVDSKIPAEKKALESSRLLMLNYINRIEPDEKYVAAMCELAKSEFSEVRGEFARSVPIYQFAHVAAEALEGMIFTETETIALSSAITKLMVIHGMDFSMMDPVYKSIYSSLRSNNHQEKIAGMKRLENHRSPDYF